MKKLLCAFAVLSLILAGCGNEPDESSVLLPDVGEAYADNTDEVSDSGKKKKADDTETSADSDSSSDSKAVGNDSTDSSAADSNDKDGSRVSDESSSVSNNGDSGDSGNSGSDESVAQSTAESKADSTPKTEKPKELYYLEGIVYEVRDGSLLINETELRRIEVGFSDKKAVKNVNPGDKVEIAYDGYLAESYPAQAHNAYSVTILESADKEYKLQRFSHNDLAFSLLLPKNWTAKDIEYPQEGDFTDWGIRFTPAGASGNLDISWHSAAAIKDPYDKLPTTINGNSAVQYSKTGKWKFYVFDNNYIAANNFFGTDENDVYEEELNFILNTLEFI